MIDYVSGFFPCKHDPSKLQSGFVMSFDSLGNQQWVCNKKFSVEGSHSSKIQLQSHSENLVYFTGNPVKFLQGHNLFGTNDIRHLMRLFFDELLTDKHKSLGLCPDPFQYDLIQDGHYELTRVDINESWHLNNIREVQAWIRAVGETAYLKHRGAGQFSGDTAYFGKKSRRWGLKCYSKGNEIKAKDHKLPPELCIPEMLEYADKSLRIEAFIRQLELKRRGLHVLSNWDIDTPTELLLECLSKLELSDVYMLKDDVLDTLPTRLRMAYQTWLNGDDLKQIMSKSAFYRCRSEMLKFGVDISTKSPKEKNNVIPLIRVLEAQPVGIPDWAYEKGLVA